MACLAVGSAVRGACKAKIMRVCLCTPCFELRAATACWHCKHMHWIGTGWSVCCIAVHQSVHAVMISLTCSFPASVK